LKQINPAFPFPVPGVVVQVRPRFQQERHERFGKWDATLDGADCLSDPFQAVFRGHACRSLWNAALQSTIMVSVSVQVVVGQARVCRSQVWEIVRRELRHSTGGGTRLCVKPEETGPKRRYKFARHERALKSQAKRPGYHLASPKDEPDRVLQTGAVLW
jgi:hypothetical protein